MRWIPIVALGISACRSGLAKEHEGLARALIEPAKVLCRIDVAEGGGCHGDCLIKDAANKGYAFARAGRLLKELPRVRDPDTEAEIAAVRERGAEVARGFGPACQNAIDQDAPVTLDTQACAHIYEKTWNARGQLLDALGTLQDSVKNASGVELPNHRKCEGQ